MALRNGTSARFTACCGCSLTALLASDLEPLHAVAIIELHTIKAKIINLFIIIIGFQLVNNNANINIFPISTKSPQKSASIFFFGFRERQGGLYI